MTRQVRLDDDVADWVEARAGGLSLSGATNRILRTIERAAAEGRLRVDGPDGAPIGQEPGDEAVAGVGPIRASRPEDAELRQVRRARNPRCAHPLESRVGPHCGLCGTRDVR